MKPIKYLKEVQTEISKVSWPSQRQATSLTTLVILLSLVIAGYLGAFDYIFSSLFEQFII